MSKCSFENFNSSLGDDYSQIYQNFGSFCDTLTPP